MRYGRFIQLCLLATLLLVVLLPRPGVAAITATTLFEGSTDGDASAYTGPSLSPSANNLILVWITNTRSSSPTVPTFTGNGLTWVQVATVTWGSSGSPTARTTLFRAMGSSPATGINSIDFAGNTQTGVAMSMIQFNNVDITGSNGANALVQSVTGRTDSASSTAGLSLTLAALGNVANASVGGFSNFINSATSISPGSGYTASSGTTYLAPSISLRAEWKSAGSTIVNVTQSGTSHIGGIAVELKADLCAGNVVTTIANSGDGSLRECIIKANLNPGTTITFNITAAANQSSGANSWWRITPTTALPTITAANTVIDATTQTSNRGNTNTLGPEVELNGATVGAGGWDGFGVASPATGVIIRGFIINQWSGSGISLWSGSGTIRGNYIGTNYAGTSALANTSYGLYLNTNGNTVGGTSAADRNVIAGNGGPGIYIVSNSNTVQGNYIGVNASAGAIVANSGHGVQILSGATGNTIGGTAAGAGNVIAGNGADGINHSSTGSNTVQGNYIGTNASSATLSNGGNGIAISAGTLNVGNASESQSNIIGPNSGAGINLAGGTVNLAGSVTVRGNMALASGTLAMGSATLNLSGNWSRTSTTVTTGTSTVVLNGTALQSLTMNGSNFNNLTITNGSVAGISFNDGFNAANITNTTPASRLTFKAGATYTLSGTLTLVGSSGNQIILLSDSPGTRFTLNPTAGAQSVNYVNVKDSQASTNNITADNSTNSGGNDDAEAAPRWVFNAPDTTPPARIIDLTVTSSTTSSITLNWTSPGDDNNSGTATSYDLRYSTSPITAGNWASATQAVGEPTPLVAGSSQSFSVTGLAAATTYYFVMTTSDEVPNTSALSDSAVGTTGGGGGGNVSYYAKRSNSVSIASGITSNSGSCGTDPTAYYIEELSKNISDMCVTANAYRWEQLTAGSYSDHYFNTAYVANTTVTGVSYQVTIRDSGTVGFQLFYVTSGGTKTYLGTEVTQVNSGIETNNYILNLSGQSGTIPTGAKLGFRTRGISVSPSFRIYVGNLDGRTPSNLSGHLIVNEAVGSSDTTAPASVTLSTGTITNNSVLLNWVSPGDDGNTGTAQIYDIRYSTAAITAGNWASATQVGGEPTPLVAGTAQTYTVTGLAPNTLYYFAIKTGDETPNWSAVSNSPSATTYDPPVGGFSVDNVIPATQISQSTNGSGIITINWKGRDNQANNVTLKTFQYSVDGGASWNAPTNGDASAALSATWSNNGGSGWTTATTLAAAPVNSFTFNTKHANVSGLNGVDQNDVRVRFLLRDATMDSQSYVTSTDFRIDALAPTATIGSAIYDAANDLLTITGTNFTTIAAASTDIKAYVDWSKFVWDINGDNATTTDISFVLGDITSLIITDDTTITLQFSAAKGIAIEATAGYSTTGGVDTLDVAAGFARDDYGNAATTDAVANGPLVTTSVSGILYDTDRTTSLGFGMTVRLLINGASMGSTTTDGSGRYTFWNNVSAGNAILVYIDNGASTAISATVTANASLSDFDLYASHLVARHDNGGALSNANLGSAKGAYVDTDIVYSVTGSALTVSGSATRLHIPAGKSFTPEGNVTTPAMSNLGTFVGGSGAITINGNLSNSGSYTASSATTTVAADFSNSGTFTAAGGTVLLNGINQNITGTTTFFNLTKTVATADTLFFSVGSTTTVTGSATLQGASGQPLSLLSITPGSRWNFNIGSSATKSFSFLNVIDSDASGSAAAKKPLIAQPSNSTDSGNNVDWFGLPSISVIKSSTLISDPVNGTTSPLHIPGAILNYQILTTNSGNGSPDTNTVVVTDALDSSKLEFDVTTGITFTANTSGLTLGTVSYAHTATPTTYTYTPTGPYDANVAGIKITTSGTFASAGASFTLNFRVRIK